MTTGVVLVREGSTYRVRTDAGELAAVLRGKLKFKDDDRGVAGDMVELDLTGGGTAASTGIRPPKALLARRAAGGRGPGHAPPIAANVDPVGVVVAGRGPAPNA